MRITKGPGYNWQPDWSPDGKYIAYRSEDGEGGLFVVPALGGEGLARKIASFGYYPRWSPTAHRSCSREMFGLHMTRTGSMWLLLTETRRVRCLPISFHTKTSERFQPRGIPTATESPYGGGILVTQPHSEAFGRYRLREVSQSDRRWHLKF